MAYDSDGNYYWSPDDPMKASTDSSYLNSGATNYATPSMFGAWGGQAPEAQSQQLLGSPGSYNFANVIDTLNNFAAKYKLPENFNWADAWRSGGGTSGVDLMSPLSATARYLQGMDKLQGTNAYGEWAPTINSKYWADANSAQAEAKGKGDQASGVNLGQWLAPMAAMAAAAGGFGALTGGLGGAGAGAADFVGSDWASGLPSAMNPGTQMVGVGGAGTGMDGTLMTGSLDVTGGGSNPFFPDMGTDPALGQLDSITNASGGYNTGMLDPYAGTAPTTSTVNAANPTSSWWNNISKLFAPPTGAGGGAGNSILGNVVTSLGNYLSGSRTASSYNDLMKSLLSAGDVSQRPGAQWALGQAQKYTGPQGMADYVNGLANPIMASYAQHLPATIAKTGDLTNSMNKSMTDMGAAISGNYNGFLNSLLGATGTTQPNNAVAAAGQAGASGINQSQIGTSGIFGTLGNIATNAAKSIFDSPSGSNTSPVSGTTEYWM